MGPIGALIDVVPAAVRAVEAALKGGGTFIEREREREETTQPQSDAASATQKPIYKYSDRLTVTSP
jgi:hypothetical protein